MTKNENIKYFILFFVSFSLALLYLISVEEFIEINSTNGMFEGLAIPDTILYRSVVDYELFSSIILVDIKNAIGPAMLWYLVDGDWYYMLLLSYFFVFLSTTEIIKISSYLGVQGRQVFLILSVYLLSPSTIYYSIGATKETVTTFAILLFIRSFLYKNVLLNVFASLVLIVFRYQLMVFVLFFWWVGLFRPRPKFMLLVLLIFLFGFPFLQYLSILMPGSSEAYREAGGSSLGIGSFIDEGKSLYLFSFIFIILRSLQTFFEPIVAYLTAGTIFNKDGIIGVYGVSQLINFIFTFPFIVSFAKKYYILHRFKNNKSLYNLYALYFSCILFVIVVGGSSFVHHRYIYPFLILMIILSMVPLSRSTLQSERSFPYVATR